MKKILVFVALLGGNLLAKPYPQQDLAALVSPQAFHFDRAIASVEVLRPLAGEYPTQFDSADDRKRARRDIRQLTQMLELVRDDNIIDAQHPQRLTLLWLLANLGVYAHNLDMEEGFRQASTNYEAALALVPASETKKRAALLEDYGRFLTTATKMELGEKYLREAVALNPELGYSLAVNLAIQGKKEEALRLLDSHLQREPDDADAQKLRGALRGTGPELRSEQRPLNPAADGER